ncbi:MAG: MFS transporter [Chloroflexota bacterium]|nr:MFS transporter [Chloroflexota bacterium]MDE2885714.1 MFS transporter [Chloroflexota bacterium]
MSPIVRGLTMLYLTTILLGFAHGMLPPIIPVLASEFEISGGFAAQVVTAFMVGRLIGQPLGGTLIDRFGTRPAVLGGPVAMALAVSVGVVTQWFWPLLIGLFIAGAADSMWMLGREIAGVDLVKPNQRGRLMSGFMGFHGVGMGLGAWLGGNVGEDVGVRAVFAIYTAIAAFVFLVSVLIPSAERPQAARSVPPRVEGSRLERLYNLYLQIDPRMRATYLVLIFATASMMLYRTAYQAIVPLHMDDIGLTPSQIGELFLVVAFGSLVMIVPAGFVVDKIGRKWATVPSTAMPGIAFLLIPFTGSLGPLIAIAVFMGFSNGLSLGSVATSTYDVAPDAVRARLQAARRTVSEVGAITGPLLGGFLAVQLGAGPVFFVYAPVLLIAAALLMFVARETLVKRPAQAPSASHGA